MMLHNDLAEIAFDVRRLKIVPLGLARDSLCTCPECGIPLDIQNRQVEFTISDEDGELSTFEEILPFWTCDKCDRIFTRTQMEQEQP